MMIVKSQIIEWLDWRTSSRVLFVIIVPWLVLVIILGAPLVLEVVLSWRWTGLHDMERVAIISAAALVSLIVGFFACIDRLGGGL